VETELFSVDRWMEGHDSANSCFTYGFTKVPKNTLWNVLLVEHILLLRQVDFVSQMWIHFLFQLLLQLLCCLQAVLCRCQDTDKNKST